MLQQTQRKYQIDYDLRRPGQNYSGLIERLQQLGAVKVLLSTWVLRSAADAVTIRDDLKRFIDGNDSLLVTGLTGEAAWFNVAVGNTLKQYIAA